MDDVMLQIIMNGTNTAAAESGVISPDEAARMNQEDAYAASLDGHAQAERSYDSD